jgi:hypothetical protein
MPCDCRNAQASKVLGHLWVRCRAEGCPAIWYRPAHRHDGHALAEFARIMLVAAWRGGFLSRIHPDAAEMPLCLRPSASKRRFGGNFQAAPYVLG